MNSLAINVCKYSLDFEDAYPKFLKILLLDKTDQPQLDGEIIDEPEIRILLDGQASNNTLGEVKNDLTNTETQSENQKAVSEFFKNKTSKTVKNKEVLKIKQLRENSILPNILRSIKNPDVEKVYFALNEAGFIYSGSEFIEERR